MRSADTLGCLFTFWTMALAQNSMVSSYSLAATIPWAPATPSSVDQSVVYNDTYYLSDRTNAGVHVISLRNNTQTTLITGFTTNFVNGSLSPAVSGPNGLVVLPDRKELWVGDGDGSIKIVSLLSNTIIANITTGSKKRADEFAYDSNNGLVVVTNPNEKPPYVSIIGAANRTVLGKIPFPNATELEQPAWNAANNLFYVSLPSSDTYPGGGISILDIPTLSVTKTFSLPNCVPAGIIFGPNQHLFVGCSEDQILDYGYASSFIVNIVDGSVIANISGLAGIDQVAYSPTANMYYASAYQMLANGSKTGAPAPILGIVNASSNELFQTIITDNVTAHSVAVDSSTGAVLVPIRAKGIQVFNLASQKVNASSTTTSIIPTKTTSSGISGKFARSQGLSAFYTVLTIAGVLALL